MQMSKSEVVRQHSMSVLPLVQAGFRLSVHLFFRVRRLVSVDVSPVAGASKDNPLSVRFLFVDFQLSVDPTKENLRLFSGYFNLGP